MTGLKTSGAVLRGRGVSQPNGMPPGRPYVYRGAGYDVLARQAPPSAEAQEQARQRGQQLARHAAKERLAARTQLTQGRIAMYVQLRTEGRSIEEAAAEMGIKAKTARQNYEPAFALAACGDGEPCPT